MFIWGLSSWGAQDAARVKSRAFASRVHGIGRDDHAPAWVIKSRCRDDSPD
jgi:hypothetical protein